MQQSAETRRYGNVPEKEDLANRYSKLTSCVYETIQEIVSERKWLKKNGRVVSQETKALFERRAKEFQKQKPTATQRKAWNKRIQCACRNDYRLWVTKWVQKIEQADNRGDTRAIYSGVKSLCGSAAFSTTKPTEKVQRKTTTQQKTDPAVLGAEINETGRASGAKPQEKHETVRASGKPTTARASGEPEITRASGETETARASGELKTVRASGSETGSEADVRASGPKIFKTKVSTRISGPRELAQVWHDFLA